MTEMEGEKERKGQKTQYFQGLQIKMKNFQKSVDNLNNSYYTSIAVARSELQTRDLSSAGRASALQAEGHRFEPYRSH